MSGEKLGESRGHRLGERRGRANQVCVCVGRERERESEHASGAKARERASIPGSFQYFLFHSHTLTLFELACMGLLYGHLGEI